MLMSKESNHNEVSWQASEYVHHEKTILWYIGFFIATAGVLALTYWALDGDIISIVVVTLMAVTFAIFANRRPRSLRYVLSDHGIKIDEREYDYSSFKSFSIMSFGVVESIYLEPLERFMPPISIYYAPEDAEGVVGMFGQYLPHRERQPDLLDRVVHRIRF